MRSPLVKHSLTTLLFLSTVILVRCSSSVKTLDESSGLRLTEAYLAARSLAMPTLLTRQSIPPSLEDDSKITPSNDKEQMGLDLVKRGFIKVGTETNSYPRVSGHFAASTGGGEAGYDLAGC
jgi:hypothetical protein